MILGLLPPLYLKKIKELNDRGEVILDDIGIAATPIFEEN